MTLCMHDLDPEGHSLHKASKNANISDNGLDEHIITIIHR